MVPKASLRLQRRYRAAKETVFAAWTQGDALKRWFAPNDATAVPLAELDLRVGGRYRIELLGGDGVTRCVSGVYKVIDPCERLVFTWTWDFAPELETLVSIELASVDGETLLTLTQTQFIDAALRDLHETRWSGSLDRLERALSEAASLQTEGV